MWGKKKNVLLRFIPSPKTYVSEGKEYVYDRCRRKKVVLTPEERVRQSVVSYFRWILRTPLRYMQTEVSMKRYGYTSRKDRADLLILRPDGNTILAVIECKAAHVEIMGLMVSLNRNEKGKGNKTALTEVSELYGFPTAAIVSMPEVVEYLESKNALDPEIKTRIDAYYAEYGATE